MASEKCCCNLFCGFHELNCSFCIQQNIAATYTGTSGASYTNHGWRQREGEGAAAQCHVHSHAQINL